MHSVYSYFIPSRQQNRRFAVETRCNGSLAQNTVSCNKRLATFIRTSIDIMYVCLLIYIQFVRLIYLSNSNIWWWLFWVLFMKHNFCLLDMENTSATIVTQRRKLARYLLHYYGKFLHWCFITIDRFNILFDIIAFDHKYISKLTTSQCVSENRKKIHSFYHWYYLYKLQIDILWNSA